VGRVRVSHELDNLIWVELQQVLEPLPDLLQDVLGLVRASLIARSRLVARGASPETDTVKGLTGVDNDTHDFVVAFVLELFTDGGKENVHPDLVVGFALLESVGPATTVLVLWIFPFWTDACLEEVVVGFWSELRSRSDVVLRLSVYLCARS